MHELRRIETFCPGKHTMLHPHRKLTSQRNVCAQPVISKEEPSPDQHAHVDREEDVREKGIADAHMGCDSAAKIPCQQDRTKDEITRNPLNDNASQQEDADCRSD